jgi:hypothetical protein
MSIYTIWIVIFALSAYFIVTDNSISKAFYMLSELVKIQYEKAKWWIIHNPANPIVKYFIWKRSYKIAEELQKEFAEKQKKM